MYSNKCLQNTYSLQTKAKCLCNTNGNILTDKYNLHYFLISSNVPFVDNEVHLIEYNDQTCSVRNVNIFKGRGQIKQMICIDSFADDQKKNHLMLCTAGNNINLLNGEGVLNGSIYNGVKQEETSLIHNRTSPQWKRRMTEDSCFVWIGQLSNLGEDSDVDTNTDMDIEAEKEQEEKEQEIENEEKEQKEQKENEQEENGKERYTDNEINKNKSDKQKEIKIKEKKSNNNNNNNTINTNNNNNNNNSTVDDGENKWEKKMRKVCELKSDKDYNDIKKIATDNCEKVINKIVVIDQHSYHLFEKNKNDIYFIQSKNVNAELNYGLLDPHHPNVLTLISDIYIYGYDLKSNKNIFSTYTNHKSKLSAVDFNPNIPNIIATSSNDGYIKLWDLRFLKNSFFSINTHSHWITSINFNNFHDELLLTTSTDFSVKLHKIEYGKNFNLQEKRTNYHLIKKYKDHEDSVLNGSWSNTDAWVFASVSYDGKCVVNAVPEKQKYKILL